MAWTKERSASKFISLLRNQVVSEFDSTKLYKHLPVYSSVNELESGIALYATEVESSAFYDLLNEEGDKWAFPVMGTVHNYLRKHDSDWYNKQDAFKPE